MKITTKSGKILETPSIRTDTNRKCTKDSKAAWVWMLEQTKFEYRNDRHISMILSFMNVNNLSQSDQDTLFDLLLPDGHTHYIFELVKK